MLELKNTVETVILVVILEVSETYADFDAQDRFYYCNNADDPAICRCSMMAIDR